MRKEGVVGSILIILLIQIWTSQFVGSKTISLKPGTYVEYIIRDGIAYKEVLNVDPEVLVKYGVINKYIIGGTIVYTNIPKEDFIKKLKEGRIRLRGKISFLFSGDLYGKVREIINKVEFPMILGNYVISFRLTLFEIIEVKYSWYCVSIKDNTALIKANFIGKIRLPPNWMEMSINRTFHFILNLNSRVAYTLSGRRIGIVPYWIPTSKAKEKIPIFSVNNIIVNGTAHKEDVIYTKLGTFDVYVMRVPATLYTPLISYIAYDKNTGLLIKARDYADPVLKYFMKISGIRAKYFEINRTNLIKTSSENAYVKTIVTSLISLTAVAVVFSGFLIRILRNASKTVTDFDYRE